MPTFNHIGGAEPSTLTFKVATVSQTRNSSLMHQEILSIGDPDTSNAIAAVLNTTPASTAWAIVTRPLGPVTIQGNSTVFQGTSPWVIGGNSSVWQGSSAWQVQVTNQARVSNSSAADFLATISGNSSVWQGSSAWQVQVTNQARVTNSSAADFLVTVSGNSTVFQGTSPWIIAGNSTVAPLPGSTWATRPIQSSAADLQMTATPVAGSTWNTRPIQSSAADLQMTATPLAGSTWNVRSLCSSRADFLNTVYQSSASELKASAWTFDGIGNAVESSTRAVGTNSTMRGIAVRQILPTFLTTASSNVFASTTWTIATSNAATIQYVYAYSITTTNQTPTKIGFYAGSTLVWPIVLAAISSAVSGVNLAVSPPAYLFAGATGAILQMKTAAASTGGGYKAGVSYWTE